MKKTTFFLALLFLLVGWQANSQIYLQESFDTSIPASWTITDAGDATGDSWTSGQQGTSSLDGTNAALVDSDAAGSGTLLQETLTTPVFDASAATTLFLDFDQYFRNIGSDTGTVEVWDGTAWVAVLTQTASAGGFNSPDQQHIDITAYANAAMQVRFIYDDASSWAWYWLVDNVLIYNATCPNPSALTVDALTATSVDLSWTAGGTETAWEIVVQPSGTGVPTGSGTGTTINAPYSDNTLSPETDYEVYVRSDCSGDFSVWSGPISFTTDCDIFTPDYLQDFTTIPANCWEVADSGDATTGPSDIGTSSWTTDGYLNNGTTGAYKINLWVASKSDWLLSPEFDLTGGPFQVEFDLGVMTYGSTTTAGTLGSDDTVELMITTDSGTTWTVLQTFDASTVFTTSGMHVVENLSTYSGTTAQFGIRASEGVIDDPTDNDVFVDNFQVRSVPSCLEPLSIIATNITETAAEISWTEGATETEWNYVLQPAGTGVPTSGTTVTTTTVSETALTPLTDYEVYVQAVCGAGNSTWVGPFNFSTLAVFNFTLDCATDGPQTIDYCYDSNDTNVFTFSSTDGTPLNLIINAGQVENNFDEVVILDSDGVTNLNAATPYGNAGQIGGLTFQSTGDTISFAIESDGSVSCQSSGYTSVNLTVTCATCINPTATFVVVDDCDNGDQFLVDVDITSLGDATSLLIEDNQGATPVSVTATGIQQFGPYPFNVDVQFTVSNEQDTSCVINSDSISLAACPPVNDNPCNATVASVNTDDTCTVVNSGTLLEATDSGVPSGSCSTSVDDDVWYEFTAVGDQQIIQIENIVGGFNVDHAVYEGTDCNNLTELYCTTEDNSLTPTLIVGNTYYIRVFSAGATATPITFDLCIQTLGVPTFCLEALPIGDCDSFDSYESVSDDSTAPSYLFYDCLQSVPNPTWKTINFDLAGDYSFTLEQTSTAGNLIDVDFIVWGPFNAQDTACVELLPQSLADCSYSITATETIELTDVPANSIYVLLITNFDGSDGTFTFTQDSGPVDGTNCQVLCEPELDYDGVVIEQGVTAAEGYSDDINLCGYTSVTLTANTAYPVDSYDWSINGIYQDGINSPTIEATVSGQYECVVGGGQCADYYSSIITNINFFDSPTAATVSDLEVCDNGSGSGVFDLESQTETILGAQDPAEFIVTYHETLSDAQLGVDAIISEYTATHGTTVFVRVEDVDAVGSNSGCASTNTSFNLLLETCIIPQGISPNNDGYNDTFDLSSFDVQSLEIFNRNGRKVYSKTNYTNQWEGQSDSGDILPVGTYYYVMKYQGTKTKAAWVYLNR